MARAPLSLTSKAPLPPPTITPLRHQRSPITTVRVSATAVTTTAMPDHHPTLEISGGAVDRFLPAFKSLHLPYKPFPIVGWNRHIETIFAAFFRKVPHVRYRRECLRTKDAGTIALDWASDDHRSLPADAPILILLPGLTGGSQDSYVKHMLVKARSKGWRVVVFNSRGCGDSPVTTPQLQSASFPGDTCHVVDHVSSRYPKANIYAAGWSLGGNILVNYLGRKANNCALTGAVSLCNPFDLVIADENLRKGFNNIYDRALREALCRIFTKHAPLFEDIEDKYNVQVGLNPQTVREYDEAITRVALGFKSVDDYYSNSCSCHVIQHVRIPLLCIQAANDPIAPIEGTPREDIKGNPNCMLIVTPQGGHLGWVAGDEAPFGAPWTDNVVMDFLEHLQKDAPKPQENSSNAEDVQQGSEDLHQAKV
ncbi:embryogenesis-associated protein EMB8 [Herrania umbratica]|uniref:Embryogenesis-associated protein EMB8 n=1 Tax=Herrania umbratica TaxID=108875 RepID=A0A6J1APB7_9ROSI|nr:embryogenesis-associated protein EMB8 [Herrania umbratica]